MSQEIIQKHQIHYLIEDGRLHVCDADGAICEHRMEVTPLPDATCIRFEVSPATNGGQLSASLVQGTSESQLELGSDGTLRSKAIPLGPGAMPMTHTIKLLWTPPEGDGGPTEARRPTTVVIETRICNQPFQPFQPALTG